MARGLRRCFEMRTGVVTAFADNEIGRLIENFILQGGVDTSMIQWRAYDGLGRSVRNGLWERYGVRLDPSHSKWFDRDSSDRFL